MQGFALIVQMSSQILNAFGLTSMLQAFFGAVLFIMIAGFVWERINTRS